MAQRDAATHLPRGLSWLRSTPMTSPASTERDVSWRSFPAAVWSLVAAVPFLLFPAIHFVRWGEDATGFTTYDLPYYVANARAILDRGHAGVYPNPFDPDPAAPVIYFHWLMAVLAVLLEGAGHTPARALIVTHIIGAVASARVMYSLVAWLTPGSRWRTLLYLLTMWSGGLLVAGKLISNLAGGVAWDSTLLELDPGQGLWCLNFGRNLILPTEAVYHALMLGLWLSLLKGQWSKASFLLLAITTTHPFTGAQALAITGACAAAQALIWRTPRAGQPAPPPLSFWIAYGGIAAAFVTYYSVFLPRFPQHREIQQTWTLGWTLSRPTILLAYGPAALLAWMAVRDDAAWRHQVRFLLIAAGVSFLLANHQWFITPRQPIHFTRGYIWTPLFLAGLPTLAALLDRARSRGVVVAGIAILGLAIIAVSDNVGFLLVNARSAPPPGFGLTKDERSAFQEMQSWDWRGVLLTDDDRLGYLAAAMTLTRPWVGHQYNTPGFDERLSKLAAFKATRAAGELLDEVDLVLTADPRVMRRVQDAGWERVSVHGPLELWQKPEE